jgi:prefoldin beta subunit
MPTQQPSEQDVEKMLREYQQVQEQLRMFAIQLDQLKAQKAEFDRANQEVGNSTGKVYVSVGGVIVETTKQKALDDLKDRAELSETRIQSITKQYDQLRSREKQLNEQITAIYKSSQAPNGAQ